MPRVVQLGRHSGSVIWCRNTLAALALPPRSPSPGNECFGQIPDFQVDQETYFDARVDGPYTVASQVGAGPFRAVAAAGQSTGIFCKRAAGGLRTPRVVLQQPGRI